LSNAAEVKIRSVGQSMEGQIEQHQKAKPYALIPLAKKHGVQERRAGVGHGV